MVQREQALSPSGFASFGPLLRYLRRRAQLTQRELAIAVGYSESYISRLEQGQRTPDCAALQALFFPALDLEYEPAWAARLLELAAAVPPGAGNASRPTSAEPAADAPQPVHLLATKLFMPRVRPGLVARPRLLSRLDQTLELPLTLVAAPAGWGKSTLLTAWLSARMHDEGGRRHTDANAAAWLSLDANDNDPATLLRYIIAALQHVAPTVGATTQALLQAPQAPPLATLLTPLINDLVAIPHDHILVLDDYHVLTAPAAHTMITFLLDNLPPQTHLIISSREDPPLPLARLRGRHELLELRASELRFTSSEATVGSERAVAEAGDLVLVPTMEPHSLKNIGNTNARVLGFFSSGTVMATFDQPLVPLNPPAEIGSPFGTRTILAPPPVALEPATAEASA